MADLVIANARLVPLPLVEEREARLETAAPGLVDVVIEDGIITSLVSSSCPRESTGLSSSTSGFERVDADGRWLIPGLWDEHTHFAHWAAVTQAIDLIEAPTAAAAAALIAQAPGDGLIDAVRFRDALWPDRPHKALLDAVQPDRPVVLHSMDGHSVWLNSAALREFGVGEHETGVLVEDAAFAIAARVTAGVMRDDDPRLFAAGRAAATRGVVGLHDLEMGYGIDTWLGRMAAGFDSLRVDAAVYLNGLERAAEAGLSTGQSLGPLLRVGHFKVITDGSVGTRTAFCVDPYPGTHDHGLLNVPPDELRAQLIRARQLGFVPAVHAIGDEANRLALDTMIELRTGGRIEHAQLLLDEDVARFAEGGIIASIQPEHAMDDRDIAERYWPGRTRRGYRFRELLDAGVRVVLGSDAPVAPLDPWFAIAAAVTRTRDGREPWHPEQAVTAAEALRCSVRTTVATGEPADLVLLDADPLGDPAGLRDMPVAATILGGRFTHRKL